VLDALERIIRELDRGQTPDPSGLGPLTALVHALVRGPSPRESLLGLRRLVAAAAPKTPWPVDGVALEALAALLSSGPELPRLLSRRPGRRLALLSDSGLGRLWSVDELRHDLEDQLEGLDPGDASAFALRVTSFRNDHYVRLAACEFLFPTLEQVGRELSNLADVCLDRTMTFVERALSIEVGAPLLGDGEPCRLVAVAMGKHGAMELNFCSDVDLVFLYSADEGQAGALSLHEFYSRVCQQVTRLLSEANPEGYSFRVDLRLRPEGSRGPICNSLAGAQRYYETWGGPYDRLAWLKARPAAGELALGEEMLRFMRPFVFPRSLHAEVVDQIQELYRRIDAEARGVGVGARQGWNVKLGGGGIRQVEFLVQALQLLHGGKQPALQERATLAALDKLLFLGLIAEHEHRQLGEAYELWRRIEHRLQLYDGRQTHVLPDAGPLRERLARHLGRDPAAFDREVASRRLQVQAIFGTLGSAGESVVDGPTPLAAPDGPARPALAALLQGELDREDRMTLLERAGFAQAERAAELLELLADKPWGPLGRAAHGAARRGARSLLEELCRSPDPDAALNHLVALALRYGPHEGIWDLLEHNPSTLRLLTSLFGSSDHLARLFIDHPELLDRLLVAGHARVRRSLQEMHDELAGRLGALAPDDVEGQLNTLRRFRNEEVLRVGLHDIAGGLELDGVWHQLSDLAQVILALTFPLIWNEATTRYGTPRSKDGRAATMAVLGLGKLGSRELTYGSDLDLIFVYSDAGSTDGRRGVDNGEFFARLAQRLIGALSAALEEGRLYEVDTRLRPSGNQGTLVVSSAAFRDYHESAAQPWERQVLIKARPVAGDPNLGAEVERWIERFVFEVEPKLDPDELRREMDRHRRRMEKELAGENGGFYNLKLGPGGLLDIDFIVQYYQLRHGGRLPTLRARSSLEALAALQQEGLIAPEPTAQLVNGYRFLRRIENRLRIVRDRSAARLPRQAAGLEVMARRLGYRQQLDSTPGARLLADYQQTTRSIRAIYERVFG